MITFANQTPPWSLSELDSNFASAVDLTSTQSISGLKTFSSALTASVNVTTPLVTAGAGSLFLNTGNGVVGCLQANGVNLLAWDNIGANRFYPAVATNTMDLGVSIAAFRTGYFGTSVVTPTIDSGSTGSLSIKTRDADTTPRTQVEVLHTTGADRRITLTGSNGGNPTIGVTGGNLAITPATFFATNVTLTAGRINLDAAASQIRPGATSFALRNNVDNADNLLMSDAGNATIRGSLVWGTGQATFGQIIKRKTADESVASSTTLQNDDHLTFSIGANEEWVISMEIPAGDAFITTGIKLAITTPSGATQEIDAVIMGDNSTKYQRTTTSGTALDFTSGSFGTNTNLIRMTTWVLNGGTPGSVTLQWAQSTSSVTNLTLRKGGFLIANRIA